MQVRRPTVESERLVEVCRDRLAHGLATAFARNLGSANDDLLALADRATSLEQQQLHFAAMAFLSNRGQHLLQQFRATFVSQFDTSVQALRQGRRPEPPQEHPGELSLVATDDFERDLAIGKLSARAACNCAQPLTVLDRQLASLLQVSRISQDDNPLYPRAVFTALLRALGDMAVGGHLALLLLHEIERQTSVELDGIYSELAQHLADSGVLPGLPVGQARTVQRSAPIDGSAAGSNPGPSASPLALEPAGSPSFASVGGAPVEPGRLIPGYGDPAAGSEDVFSQLTRAIQAAAGVQLPPPPAYGAQLSSPFLQASPESIAAPGVTRLIEALTGLQRGWADTPALPGLDAVQLDPQRGNVLQQIRSTPLASWSRPVDALTIDIVSMLFDAIFNDPDLPAALRAEIAKLQIPVLKVALIDKAFFSNKRHPARRLLDAIASSGLGRNDADEPRLMAKIRSIVDKVVAGFETDIDIFATQVKKLDEFLEDEEARAQSRTTRVVDKLAQKDREELAHVRAESEIASRMRGAAVPIEVADFLSHNWCRVLVPAFLRDGEGGAPWIEALATMDDLVWSVAPKQCPEERSRLLATLPALLKKLRVGLESVDLKDAWDPFFAQLIRLHVGALHKDNTQYDPARPEAIDPSATQAPAPTPATEDTSTGLKTLELAEMPSQIEYCPPDPQPEPPKSGEGLADRHMKLAQSLGVGAWVEFQSLRGTRKTLRLSWVSDFRGVFLFTNRQGENALTLAATSLADHLREGRARLLSQDRLTDRAVAQLLQQSRVEPTSYAT